MVDFSLLEPAEENEEVSRAKMNVNLAHRFEPQKEASVLKTSRETGLTPALVRIREKEIKEQMLTPDVASMALRSPGTTKYLSTLEYASISKGDFDRLEKIEQIKYKENQRRKDEEIKRLASEETWGMHRAIGRTILKTVPTILKAGADVGQFVFGKAESDLRKVSLIQKVITGGKGVGSWLNLGDRIADTLGYAKEKARQLSSFEKEVLSQGFMNLPEEKRISLWEKPSLLFDPEWLVQNVGDAANSMLPVLGATLLGGPGLGAVTGGGMEGASLYDDLLTDGVPEDKARTAALSFGFVSGILNKIGLDKIMGKVSATTLMKKIALRASAGATEAATEYMEEPFQAAFTGLAKGESGSKIAGRVVESLKNIDVIPGSFILGAGMSSTAQKKAAEENDTFHDNLNKSVNESGTKALSPIATQAHLESIEVEDQYLSFEGVEMLFQSETGQPILEKLGIDPIQAEDAVTHGSDIKISMAQAHAVLSPEEWQTIRPDIKEAPSALTKREADRINPEEEAAAVENKVKEAKERRKAYRAEIQRIKEETTKAGYQPEVSDAFTQILDRFAYTEGQKIDFLKKISVRAGEFKADANGNVLYQKDATSKADIIKDIIAPGMKYGARGERKLSNILKQNLDDKEIKSLVESGYIPKDWKKAKIKKYNIGDEVEPSATFDMGAPTGSIESGVSTLGLDNIDNIDNVLEKIKNYTESNGRIYILESGTAYGGKDRFGSGEVREAILENPVVIGIIEPDGTFKRGIYDDETGEYKIKKYKTLYQNENEPLAAVTITSDKYIISLFEGANATSIIHEAGHIFHKELEAMASLPDAPEDLIKDVEDLREYLGVKPGEELSDDQKEKFADSFMLYVEEGKAPTVQLESVFERFRKWMMSVIKKVYVHPEAILNDKIRAIFDRMLGAEAEFKDAENENGFTPLTKAEMDSLGIVPDDQKYMNRLAKEASRKSEIELHKARNKSYGLYIKQWREDARNEVNRDPGQKFADDLSKWDGVDRQELISEYGTVVLDKMPGRVPPVFKAGGMPLVEAAYLGGFNSVDDMVIALKRVRPKKEAIKEIVDEKIREHDQQFQPIDFLVNTDEYRKYMETKAKYIERSGGKTVTTTPQSAYKVYAEKQFRGLMVKDATVISRYLAALKKFAGIEREKVRLKKTEEAIDANEKFRLNYELAGLSSKLREQVKKTEKRAKAFLKSETDNECRQQALKLIKRFGFVEEVQLDEDVKTFSDFLDNQSNSGKPATDPMFEIAPVYSDFLMMESYAKPYKDLTVQEFEELDEALKYLKRRGSKIKKGRLTDGITSRDAKVDELSDAVLSNKRRVKVRPEDSFFREMSDKKRWYFAHHDTLMFLARRLDGFVTLKGQVGPVENFITKQINRAEDRNTRMTKEMYDRLKPMSDHFLKRSKEFHARIDDSGVPVPEVLREDGRYWTFERVIMMAMHQGNKTNRQRLRDGLGMSQENVQRLIDHVLNDSDWKMVQETWNTINSLWPDLDSAFFKINDHHQRKVKADPFITKDGMSMAGGYFPLMYDGSLSKIKAEWNEKEDMMNQIGAMFPSVKPKQGMLEARSKGAVSIPLDLSLSVIQKHIETSLRYITHAEILTDINSVIKQPKFRKAVTDVEGKHIYDEIRPALAFVAHPKMDSDQLNNWLMREVKRSSSYMLYLNAKSATNQFFGVITAFSSLGNGNTALGMARFIKASLKVARQPFQMHAELMNIDYMRKREKEGGDRDFARSRKMMKPTNIDIKGYTWEDVQDFGFSMMRAVDALTVTPVWFAAYDKGMSENGGDRQKAIEAANDVIRTTQESKEPSDLNAFQRATGWHRLFTMFSAFAQKYGTLQRFHYAAWKEGAISTPKYLSIVAMDNIGQPLITSLAFSLLWGKFDEDDTIADVVGAQFMGLFMIREIVGGAIRMGGRKGNGVSSPALAGIEMMYNTTTSLINLVTELDNEENWESAGLGLAELLSYQARVPAPKLYRNIVKGIDQYENEDGTVFNIIAPDNRR